jgi:transposase-like protein
LFVEFIQAQLVKLENWVRLHAKGQLKGAGDEPVSPEQMELTTLRAENARLSMERDI